MRARMVVALLFVAGLLVYVPSASAGKLEDKAWKTVDKLGDTTAKAEANFSKWLDWASGQISKPGGCAKVSKVADKVDSSATKQWDKLHDAVHKAREQLDKLLDQGANAAQISEAHTAINTLWYGYWDSEDEFNAALAVLLGGCP